LAAVLGHAGGAAGQKLDRTSDIVDGSSGAGTPSGGTATSGAGGEGPAAPAPIETSWARQFAFLRRPYAGGLPGYLIIEEKTFALADGRLLSVDTEPAGAAAEDGRRAGLKAEAGYQYDWGGVHVIDASLRLDTAIGLGLLAAWTGFVEPAARRADRETDHLHLAELAGTLRLAARSTVRLSLVTSGLVLAHGDSAWGGIAGGFALEVFPVRPLVLSWRSWAGYLMTAGYAGSRLTLGAMLGPVELFAGYGFRAFFTTGGGAVIYHGAIAGIGAWF
jgi:hypothetical protein